MLRSKQFPIVISVIFLYSASFATDYYVDPGIGSDSDSGLYGHPWSTIAHALPLLAPSDRLYLADGDYGAVTIGVDAATGTALGHIKMIAQGSSAYFKPLVLSDQATLKNYYYDLEGVKVVRDYEPGTVCDGFNTCGALIKIGENTGKVFLSNIEAHGYTTDNGYPCSVAGVWFVGGGTIDVVFDRLNLHTVNFGLLQYGTVTTPGSGNKITNSQIHDLMGSAVGTYVGLDEISNTRISDEIPQYYYSSHAGGSGLAMRGGNIKLKNVLVKNYGMTRPIRFYQGVAGAGGYGNVLMENVSVEYSVSGVGGYTYNRYAEIIDIGSNFTIKNSNFTGGFVGFFATGVDGSGFTLYNSLASSFMINNYYDTTTNLQAISCATADDKMLNMVEGKNILGAIKNYGGGYECNPTVLTSGSTSIKTATFSALFVDGVVPDTDFRLADGSQAINFGDASLQSSESLGIVSADGFLMAGRSRTSSAHSSGAYEYGTENTHAGRWRNFRFVPAE